MKNLQFLWPVPYQGWFFSSEPFLLLYCVYSGGVANPQETWSACAQLHLLSDFRRDLHPLHASTQNSLQLFPVLQEYPAGVGDQSSGMSPSSIWTLKMRPQGISKVSSWVFTSAWMSGPEAEDLSADASSCCTARLHTSTQCHHWYVLPCCVPLGVSFCNPYPTLCDPTPHPETQQIPFQIDHPPDAGVVELPKKHWSPLISWWDQAAVFWK